MARLVPGVVFVRPSAYASPEQIRCSKVDFRTDIFSFGVLMYELACGKHPFSAPESISTIARILLAEVEDLVQINPAVPKEFERIIRRCLRKDPAERYGATRELLADLDHVHTAFPPTPTPFPSTPPHPRT